MTKNIRRTVNPAEINTNGVYMNTDFDFTSSFAEEDTEFHEARESVFDLYGLYKPASYPNTAAFLPMLPRGRAIPSFPSSANTAGGRLRFAQIRRMS